MAEYTVQDYVVYMGIFLMILWGFSRFFFNRVKFDRNFLLISLPYIIFGVTLRVLVDVGFYERNPLWNITPGVYITAIAVLLIGVVIGLFINNRFNVEYWYAPFLLGIIAAGYTTYNILPHIIKAVRILYPVAMASILTLVIFYLSSFSSSTRIFRESSNIAIIFAHLLDGSATFFGIDFYNFTEEHLLPDFLINFTGTAFVMIPLKIAVVLPAIYLLEKWYLEEKAKGETAKATQEYQILKFVFFILGIGPGLRDAILPATILG